MIDLLFCSLLSHSLDPSPRLLNPSQNPPLPPPPPPLSSTLPHLRRRRHPSSLFSLQPQGKKHRIGLSGSPRNEFKFDQVKSRKDLAIACIKHKYPFNIGEHEYFEIFLSGLNPDFKLPCRNTIRSDVIEVYEEEKVKIYKLLDGLRCKVSLTTDIWTSEHSHVAYCCLTVHFVDDSWELQKKILAFRKMPYPHDGETLFSFMKEMILEWNLDKKLFSIVVDNATNNDVMIRKTTVLAKIARDILAVPATTVASEAAFSVGGRIIDESRTCLLPDAVEALVVADDWIESIPKRSGVTKAQLLQTVEEERE
ncbi:UNVERIFIED_CONTAM: putative AC transposase [Sesamum calycinum]|uniref:AC transposase n=1 Tax=Sesamum calycinum TaxID=2727403 RepID=A0AAW2J292_9LAMI